MNIRMEDVRVGRAFVTLNEGVVRQIVFIQEDTVAYRAFFRETGKYAGIETCRRDTFVWKVKREATPEEYNRMDVSGAEQIEKKAQQERTRNALYYVTTEQLWAELRRRGEID